MISINHLVSYTTSSKTEKSDGFLCCFIYIIIKPDQKFLNDENQTLSKRANVEINGLLLIKFLNRLLVLKRYYIKFKKN